MVKDERKKDVKVFISSTFRDMQCEREYLIKKIFPEIKRKYGERGVNFQEIDLRWGINTSTEIEDYKKTAKVVTTCLEEIERIKPYFICLLGDRYGTVPKKEEICKILETDYVKKDDEISKILQEIANGKSLTEMEILKAVLNTGKLADKALFYFRYTPKYLQDMKALKKLPECVVKKDDGVIDEKFYIPEEDKKKIRKLKKSIKDFYKKSKYLELGSVKIKRCKYYYKIERLGEKIKEDLLKMLDYEHPEKSFKELLEKYDSFNENSLKEILEKEYGEEKLKDKFENIFKNDLDDFKGFIKLESDTEDLRRKHTAFALSRTNLYVPIMYNKKLLNDKKLFKMVEKKKLVALIGESGTGKSALLANFTEEYQEQFPETHIIKYFVGIGSSSSSLNVLEDIKNELLSHFPEIYKKIKINSESTSKKEKSDTSPYKEMLEKELEEKMKEINEIFENLINDRPEQEILIIIDAINQLTDSERALDILNKKTLDIIDKDILSRLNLHLVISTTRSARLEEILNKNKLTQDSHIEIKPIGGSNKEKFLRDLIKEFNDKYAKEVTEEQRDLLSRCNLSSYPLFLATILDEIRVFGLIKSVNDKDIVNEVSEKIEDYTKSVNLDEFFEKVIKRLEEDFRTDDDGFNIVEKLLCYIYVSEKGLSRDELIDLFIKAGKDNGKDYINDLNYLLSCLEYKLYEKDGLYHFFHESFRDAVYRHYKLYESENLIKYRTILFNYFNIFKKNREEENRKHPDKRILKELTYQICRLADCGQLDYVKKKIDFEELLHKIKTENYSDLFHSLTTPYNGFFSFRIYATLRWENEEALEKCEKHFWKDSV